MNTHQISYTEHASPLGRLLLAASERGLCGIYFEEHRHFKGHDGWRRDDARPILRRAATQLDAYFAAELQEFDVHELALDFIGTPFQQAVWQDLLTIPYGAASTYGEQARRLGKPKAMRAVGAAIGRNPVSIIVPCHRVLARDQALTGYAGGLARKQALLDLERARRV